jgi:hypothetical protein
VVVSPRRPRYAPSLPPSAFILAGHCRKAEVGSAASVARSASVPREGIEPSTAG